MECNVNCGGEEDRTNGNVDLKPKALANACPETTRKEIAKLTNLHEESLKIPWIVVHHNAASISDHFAKTAAYHQGHEYPHAPLDPLKDMNSSGETEKS